MASVLLGVTAAILILCTLIGYYRGLLKSVFGLFSVVISLVLMIVLQPMVCGVLQTATPVHAGVQTAVKGFLEEELIRWLESESTDTAGDGADAAEEGRPEQDMSRGEFLPEMILSPEQQEQLMELTHLPDILWESGRNTVEMQAEAFLENVSERIADAVVNALSYLLTFVIVFVLIRVLYAVLGIMGKLPVIHGVNQLLGGVLGLLEGLVLMWLLCQVITTMIPVDKGKEILAAIYDSPILSVLYRQLMSVGR